MIALPAVTGRYVVPDGRRVEVVALDEAGTLVDVEVTRDGELVDYLEDVTPWYVDELARHRCWRKVAR